MLKFFAKSLHFNKKIVLLWYKCGVLPLLINLTNLISGLRSLPDLRSLSFVLCGRTPQKNSPTAHKSEIDSVTKLFDGYFRRYFLLQVAGNSGAIAKSFDGKYIEKRLKEYSNRVNLALA